MKKCPKCKRNIENDKAKFCKYCGASLDVTAASPESAPTVGQTENKPRVEPKPSQGQSLGITLDVSDLGPKSTPKPTAQPKPLSPLLDGPSHIERPRPLQQNANPGRRVRKMNFIGAVRSCFRNYATFSGRANRPEFWYFYLFSVLVQILFLVVFVVLAYNDAPDSVGVPFMILWLVWLLVMILPTLAVTVRRLHDTGRSGANVFLGFIPIVGPILMIIFLVAESDINSNRFGHPQP